MNSLCYFLIFLIILVRAFSDTNIRELEKYFSMQELQIRTLGDLLKKIKEISLEENLIRTNLIGNNNFRTKTELEQFLFEGDILLSENQALWILMNLKGSRNYRSLSNDPQAIWTELPIRYRFDDSLEKFEMDQINDAINYWQNHTCIRFELFNSEHQAIDYIEFFKGQGKLSWCYSTIGRLGGKQGISIGAGCERTGVIEHEVGHALGLWHEQSRPDANDYIKVEKNLVLRGYLSDFQQKGYDEIRTLGVPYDYGSVMHYGSTAFSSDGNSKTLITLNPFYQNTIGQREKLSFYDIQIINKAYCSDKCKKIDSMLCMNGGYIDPNNCSKCICPHGYGGFYCANNQEPTNANCGGMLEATEEWTVFESPGYSADGYVLDQLCNWIITTSNETRIELEFIDDFSFFCSNICLDYVEIKLAKDQRNTGPRFCCYEKPIESFISEANQVAVIFRTQVGQETGFRLQFRTTTKEYKNFRILEEKSMNTQTQAQLKQRTNGLTEWGPWSECSRPCGGCGIQSRIRTCEADSCINEDTQEFNICNYDACPIDANCQRVMFLHRPCDKGICTHAADEISSCTEPSCCPPFLYFDGKCIKEMPGVINSEI